MTVKLRYGQGPDDYFEWTDLTISEADIKKQVPPATGALRHGKRAIKLVDGVYPLEDDKEYTVILQTAPPPSLSAQAPSPTVEVFGNTIGLLASKVDKTITITDPFVNRQKEIDEIIDIMEENDQLLKLGINNDMGINLLVTAQHLGSGKTALALNFHARAKQMLQKFHSPENASRISLLDSFQYITIDLRCYQTVFHKYQDLKMALSVVLMDHLCSAFPLVFDSKSTSRLLIKDWELSTILAKFNQHTGMKLWINLDEIDQILETTAGRVQLSRQEVARRFYDLLDALAIPVGTSVNFFYLSGRSPVIFLLGRHLFPELVTPVKMRVHFLILHALSEVHIKELLGDEYKKAATRLHQWSAGIPRIVVWGRMYLEATGDTDLTDNFIHWILKMTRSGVAELDAYKMLQGAPEWAAYIRMAEFAVLQLHIPLTAKFVMDPKNSENSTIPIMELVRNLQLYITEVDGDSFKILFPEAILQRIALDDSIDHRSALFTFKGLAKLTDLLNLESTMELLPLRSLYFRFTLWGSLNSDNLTLGASLPIFKTSLVSKMLLRNLPWCGFPKIVNVSGQGGAAPIGQDEAKLASLRKYLNSKPDSSILKVLRNDFQLIRKCVPGASFHVPAPKSSSGDGWIQDETFEITAQMKSDTKIGTDLILAEYAKVNPPPAEKFGTFVMIGRNTSTNYLDDVPAYEKIIEGQSLLAIRYPPGTIFKKKKPATKKKKQKEMSQTSGKRRAKNKKGPSKKPKTESKRLKTESKQEEAVTTKAKGEEDIEITLPDNMDIVVVMPDGFRMWMTDSVADLIANWTTRKTSIAEPASLIPTFTADLVVADHLQQLVNTSPSLD